MTYTKTQWVDNATPLSAANLNNLETQYDDAIATGDTRYARVDGGEEYLRTDVNAPNPQTVKSELAIYNPSNLGTTSGNTVDLLDPYSNASNTVHLKQRLRRTANGTDWTTAAIDLIRLTDSTYQQSIVFREDGSTVQINPNGKSTTAQNTLDDGSGNMTVAGSITASSGQLGSASGTWTPASGSLNVAVGAVINVAAVPSGAVSFEAGYVSGLDAGYFITGGTTPSGAFWGFSASGYQSLGYANGLSSTSIGGNTAEFRVFDGSYEANGYFQLNNGYLQFVVVSNVSSSTGAQDNIRWDVS